MKRHRLALVAIVAVAGLGLAVTNGQSAFGSPTRLTQNAKVGQTLLRGLGNGPNFAVKTCTSASPTIVPCQIDPQSGHNAVRLWCFAPTLSNVAITITYFPNGTRHPTAPTTLSVHCKQPRTVSVKTPSSKPLFPMTPTGPAYSVTNCTTNVIGTQCDWPTGGEQIVQECQLSATLNTLPVLVTATVTLAGPAEINGLTMKYYFECI